MVRTATDAISPERQRAKGGHEDDEGIVQTLRCEHGDEKVCTMRDIVPRVPRVWRGCLSRL